MSKTPNFIIYSIEPVSQAFRDRSILTFQQAVIFISQLPYGRNTNKEKLVSIFRDQCGTCSKKHAVLKQLCIENDFGEIRLFTGIFKMNGRNTPSVAGTLKRHHLDYIPEAHCYLKYHDMILDYTKHNSDPSDFITDLMEEVEILPYQITDYKINYHKEFLKTWLIQNDNQNYTLEEVWGIREQCIRDLATKRSYPLNGFYNLDTVIRTYLLLGLILMLTCCKNATRKSIENSPVSNKAMYDSIDYYYEISGLKDLKYQDTILGYMRYSDFEQPALFKSDPAHLVIE